MGAKATRERSDGVHIFSGARFGELCLIGEGQNAIVYEGFDVELGRPVAIKVAIEDTIPDELAANEELGKAIRGFLQDMAKRGTKSEYTLLREARITAKVRHPGVVSVLEVGRFAEDSSFVVVMPLLDGAPLPSTAPWRSILERVLPLAGGLAALHEAGIVHRDLKLDNILYDDDGRPCIADLGLACELSDETAMNHFAGSPQWMAPEVLALGGGSGVANDIFAFSMVAFELFYGHPPFVDEDAKAEGRVSDILRGDDMPGSLREVLVKGLAPDPAERWPSMQEMLAALEAIWRRPELPPARLRRPKRRWLGAAAAAGLSIGLGVGMCVVLPEAKADGCDDVSRELGDFWNDDVQVEVRVVLGTRKAGDYLESFASRWVTVRANECQAAKREGRPERPSPCTESVRNHLSSTIGTLLTPHQRQGLDFEKILGDLPAPEYCLEHPEDGEYGIGGLYELRTLDIELKARVAGDDLETAERRQADYMLAAREISSLYDIARAIDYRAELHRRRGELDEAEDDFKRAYSEAMSLGAIELQGEAMMMLAAVAGAKGDFAGLEERAFVARTVFVERRPDKVAELLQIQGLALAEGDPTQRERGLALLRDAVELREAQYSHYGGTRERVGWALEALARGLLAVDEADEAVQFAEQSLAIHELEYGGLTKRAHELRRLLFVTQIEASNFDDADLTQRIFLDPLYSARDYDTFVEASLWVASVYEAAGARSYAENKLKALLATIERNELASLRPQVEEALAKLGMEP